MDPNQENIFFYDVEFENPAVLSTSFDILNLYSTNLKRLHSEVHTSDEQIKNSKSESLSSALSVVKLARDRLVELNNSKKADVDSILSRIPHKVRPQNQLSFVEEIDVAVALQESARQIAQKRFVSARKLLSRCKNFASQNGTPFQRVVYYFAEALYEKMDNDWGFSALKFDSESFKRIDERYTLITLEPIRMSCEQDFSTTVVCQNTNIQSILDNMASAKRVHLIDLSIKNGSHWTILIQALADRSECPVELVKITAIGTSKEILEGTGKRLSDFAETMNVPFCFDFVLSELKDIKKEMFKIEDGETLAIYSCHCLWGLLAWPNHLENLINVIKDLNPSLVTVSELDADLNSPIFLKRFDGALFYFSAVFECLKVSLENHPFRKITEETHIKDMIQSAIAREGIERIHSHERSRFYRKLFRKHGFVEAELSPSALSQARLLLERSAIGKFFSIETDGKCLSAGWKGTPLEFASVWKLQGPLHRFKHSKRIDLTAKTVI